MTNNEEIKAKQSILLTLLRAQFNEVPKETESMIRQITDLTAMNTLLDIAVMYHTKIIDMAGEKPKTEKQNSAKEPQDSAKEPSSGDTSIDTWLARIGV